MLISITLIYVNEFNVYLKCSPAEYERLVGSQHAPIFAVVMRSPSTPKMLECHAFICKSTEDAIVIAATLYQSLMSHVTCSNGQNNQRRAPRNKNGISCVSIASSSDITNSHQITRRLSCSTKGRKNSLRSVNGMIVGSVSMANQSDRKKRPINTLKGCNSISSGQGITGAESISIDNKKKSYKSKRAPPIPTLVAPSLTVYESIHSTTRRNPSSLRMTKKQENLCKHPHSTRVGNSSPRRALPEIRMESSSHSTGLMTGDNSGDILTRVAIPRSGSFLNTSGLSRYKSKTARRYCDKVEENISNAGEGGGGG